MVLNTFFPILNQNENENLKIFGCDYSKVAVDLVKSNESFISNHEKGVAYSSVWDLANPEGTSQKIYHQIQLI